MAIGCMHGALFTPTSALLFHISTPLYVGFSPADLCPSTHFSVQLSTIFDPL